MKRRPRRERLFVCECWRLQAGTAITSFAVASSSVTSREARLDCFFAAPPGWRRAVARNGRPLFGQSHRMKERRSLWEFEAALLGRGPELGKPGNGVMFPPVLLYGGMRLCRAPACARQRMLLVVSCVTPVKALELQASWEARRGSPRMIV